MRQELSEWRKDTGDRLPKKRTLDEFDRLTGIATDARIRPRWSKEKMINEGLLERD